MQPEVGWDSTKVVGKHASWETLVNAVVAMRLANPVQQKTHKWATDVVSVANEVDAYNARICRDNGWNQFLMTGAPPAAIIPVPTKVDPDREKLLSVAAKKATKIFSGIMTLNEWLDSGEPPVPMEQAESRAATCIACHLNGSGDFTSWFTIPAAAAIKRQIERMHQREIKGSTDDRLGVCGACLCPLVLKTKTPIKFIKDKISDSTVDELRKGNDCWVIKEMGAV